MLTLKNEIDEPYCIVSLIADANAVFIEWHDATKTSQVEIAASKIQEIVEQNNSEEIISDFRKCKKFDQDANEFLNTTFYPELSTSGVNRHAIIFSEEVFKRIMKKSFCRFYSGYFEVEVFKGFSDALNWLQKKYVKSAS
ncbi:hypothetical protein [Chondrinema litorale]|uniref:hypothetical protein n=1 Tax=Chondrinema litorale TaxID=2994555 RepID=UPI002543C7CC|nr:hypothetical protein [Chondrinema litorale]UZR92306.1 hypothetical protein OQ292_10580 [Chondrinema litorale]